MDNTTPLPMEEDKQEVRTAPKQLRGGGKIRVPLNAVTSNQRMSRFCFTLNNYSEDEFDVIKQFDCKWMVAGREKGAFGTPHIQGACLAGKQVTLSYLKKHGFQRCHIELMKGSPQDSLDYCSKEDPNPFQKGSFPKPGKRNDLAVACAMIRSGKTLQDIAQDDTSAPIIVKYFKGLMQYRALVVGKGKPRTPPEVVWLHGETGTGKTRNAVKFAETYGPYWMSNGSLKWFDGYQGESIVILDDIRADSCSFDFLLRLLDRYQFRVEYKGGFVDWQPLAIIITSWGTPEQLFTLKNQGDIAQLLRRIRRVLEYKSAYTSSDDPPDLVSLLAPFMPIPGPSDGSSTSNQSRSLEERRVSLDESDNEVSFTEIVDLTRCC